MGVEGIIRKEARVVFMDSSPETRSTDLFVPVFGPHCEVRLTLWLLQVF